MSYIKRFITASTFHHNFGWQGFICPFTNTLFDKEYHNFYELESHIKQFRIDNQLPEVCIPYRKLSEELQDFFCKREPICKSCTVNEYYLADKGVGPAEIGRALKAYTSEKYKEVFHPSEACSVEHAEKRLEQCLKCPLHNPEEKLTDNNIGFLSEVWRWMHKHKKTKYKNEVGKCKGCGCFCEIKAFYTIEAAHNSLTLEEKKIMTNLPLKDGEIKDCWQIKEWKDKYGE
jgi:hypothetical protein